jgi:polyribonucleotide nucleotidyltransferase
MHTVSLEMNGKTYSIETGRFAKLADGAVMVRCGDTMVLVTACASTNPATVDFLPLTVEYREKMGAAGKIPGGFLKREARPSEKEILTARLIDRPCRPMFPKNWRHETQIVATVFSADQENDPDMLAVVGASAALMISNIPFKGPISEVRVGRINGEFVVNPTHSQLKDADIDMTVAGTDASIVMVEGSSKEISEEDFMAALEFGHEEVKRLNGLQRELMALVPVEKREAKESEEHAEIRKSISEATLERIQEHVRKASAKDVRSAFRKEIRAIALEKVKADFGEHEEYAGATFDKLVDKIVGDIEKTEMREMILKDNVRLDGRNTTTVRPINCEIGVLPRPHGSALFTRGETQSLTTVTLGTKDDEQMIDGLLPTYELNYMLHYNFPPYSTGEVGRMTGTSRREIGHGNLAERSLKEMIPSREEFPYTIRVVSDVLESNGSSSMATVCAGSLALMHAGVPMKKPVAGIAMGLIKEGDRVAILSDILGDEDHLGDMDFKVAGTADGITSCQMDMKIEGLSIETIKTALYQAHEGRQHILNVMSETISKPNEELSQYAPRLTTIMIPVESIGAVIGSGGETIRSIVKETGAEINIQDDGTVVIAATSTEAADAAIAMIKALTRKPEVGDVYNATVKEVREGLGAIVEFLPKQKGLLHISQFAWERTENPSDVLKAGDKVEVKLIEIQSDGKFRLSRKALLERPEGVADDTGARPPREGGGDRRGGYGDRDRRGGGGYDRDRRGGDDRRGGGYDRDRRDDRRSDDRPRYNDGNRDGGNRDNGNRAEGNEQREERRGDPRANANNGDENNG